MHGFCEWCQQEVPLNADGTCFLGHPASATHVVEPSPVEMATTVTAETEVAAAAVEADLESVVLEEPVGAPLPPPSDVATREMLLAPPMPAVSGAPPPPGPGPGHDMPVPPVPAPATVSDPLVEFAAAASAAPAPPAPGVAAPTVGPPPPTPPPAATVPQHDMPPVPPSAPLEAVGPMTPPVFEPFQGAPPPHVPAAAPPATAPAIAPPEAIPVPRAVATAPPPPQGPPPQTQPAVEWEPVPELSDPPIYEYRPGPPHAASPEVVMAGLPPAHEVTAGAPPRKPPGAPHEPSAGSRLFPNWGATTGSETAPLDAHPDFPGGEAVQDPAFRPGDAGEPIFPFGYGEQGAPPYEQTLHGPQHDALHAPHHDLDEETEPGTRRGSSKFMLVLLVVVAVAALAYAALFLI